MFDFDIVGVIHQVEVIAAGAAVCETPRLRRMYGGQRWRKMKGMATIQRRDGTIVSNIEVHWYEAHGIGKKEFKIKEPA